MIYNSKMKLNIDLQWNFSNWFPQGISFWPAVRKQWPWRCLPLKSFMIIAPVLLLNKSLNPWCFRNNKNSYFNIYYPAPEMGCSVHCIQGSLLNNCTRQAQNAYKYTRLRNGFTVMHLSKEKYETLRNEIKLHLNRLWHILWRSSTLQQLNESSFSITGLTIAAWI